ESRSAFSFCSSPSRPEACPAAPRSAVTPDELSSPSPAGSSCSRSSSADFTSDFPFAFATYKLLRFVQDLVKQSRNIRDGSHGVLIVHAGWADDGQRPHHVFPHSRGRSDQHKVLHRRHCLIEPNDHADGFLLHVKVSTKKL